MNFAYYYLKQFGNPDVVIATKATDNHKKSLSIREEQTVAPLLTLLAEKNQNEVFTHPDRSTQISDLVDRITKDYSGKKILICWGHHEIDPMVALFGVDASKIPVWEDDDYNTVYLLNNFGDNGPDFTVLRDQYTTDFEGDFIDIIHAVQKGSLTLTERFEYEVSDVSCSSMMGMNMQFLWDRVQRGFSTLSACCCSVEDEEPSLKEPKLMYSKNKPSPIAGI